jgi:hypothetical protein
MSRRTCSGPGGTAFFGAVDVQGAILGLVGQRKSVRRRPGGGRVPISWPRERPFPCDQPAVDAAEREAHRVEAAARTSERRLIGIVAVVVGGGALLLYFLLSLVADIQWRRELLGERRVNGNAFARLRERRARDLECIVGPFVAGSFEVRVRRESGWHRSPRQLRGRER